MLNSYKKIHPYPENRKSLACSKLAKAKLKTDHCSFNPHIHKQLLRRCFQPYKLDVGGKFYPLTAL